MIKVAFLFQNHDPPTRNGTRKPRNPGGHADSGADVAYALKELGVDVATPNANPDVKVDHDWVFSDTTQGIQQAIDLGANVFWLNTGLYEGHPIEKFMTPEYNIQIVGQTTKSSDLWDDKVYANTLLKNNGLHIPSSYIININDMDKLFSVTKAVDGTDSYTITNPETSPLSSFTLPYFVKPIRGRGSQGVTLVHTVEELYKQLKSLFDEKVYGEYVYIEHYLQGQEITVTVMPKGDYFVPKTFPLSSIFKDLKDSVVPLDSLDEQLLKNFPSDSYKIVTFDNYWALPPVVRFNQVDGVAPFNGKVAVSSNSKVVSIDEWLQENMQNVCRECEKAAEVAQAKAPVRIDCCADSKDNKTGVYYLFDFNMKPNTSVPSRPHRQDRTSLVGLAAGGIGWDYKILASNTLKQRWKT